MAVPHRVQLIGFKVLAVYCGCLLCILTPCKAKEISENTALKMSSDLQVVTGIGGDRATAYVMSNKIVRRGNHFLVTWIDSERTNHWTTLDGRTGKVIDKGTVGGALRDNHCGAALAKDIDGTIHIVLGGHFSKLVHYLLPPGATEWELAKDGAAIGKTGPGKAPTYPSLVCDDKGTLHLTYRSEPNARNATVCYCHRKSGGTWSEPIVLIQNVVKEHSWTHHAIQNGVGEKLHLLAAITLPYPQLGANARYYGAAHLYSNDGGKHWLQYGSDKPIKLPITADKLQRIEGESMKANRTSPTHEGKGGPWHPYVFRMMLSNISLDAKGNPRFIMGNLMEGTADLWRYESTSGWSRQSLRSHVDELTKNSKFPPYRIQHLPCLARLPNGDLDIVLMVSPIASTGWGADYTRLVRLRLDEQYSFKSIQWIAKSNSRNSDWIPGLEFYNHREPYDAPALIFTRGRNAGGYGKNVNDFKTKVVFQLPQP